MAELNHSTLIDFPAIKEKLNGSFNDYLMPDGLMASNLQRIDEDCDSKALVNIYHHYTYNLANMEDDHIQELLDNGYIEIID